VACGPAGPRWLQVRRLCAGRGLPLVCIRPLVCRIAGEQQDDTGRKTDEAGCVMIARLAAGLHCYLPGGLDQRWAQLRHLGRRRAQLITAETASVHRVGDFLPVAWPTVIETCAQPLLPTTWLAAVEVVTSRCGGQPGTLAARGDEAFPAWVRGAVAGRGGQRAWGTISGRIFAVLADTGGVVVSSRRGLLRRRPGELDDLRRVRAARRAVEAEMAAVLADLGRSRLGGIPGLAAAGAAAILAETGGPRRYDNSSSLVKHAGLSPSDNASGAFHGEARISRRGRPGLRLTAWRAVRPMLRFNPVMAAKYQAMTTEPGPPGRPARGRGSPRPLMPPSAPAGPRPGPAPPPCCAGSTPPSPTAPAGTPKPPRAARATRPPPTTRRQPDQRFPSLPPHLTGALNHPPR